MSTTVRLPAALHDAPARLLAAQLDPDDAEARTGPGARDAETAFAGGRDALAHPGSRTASSRHAGRPDPRTGPHAHAHSAAQLRAAASPSGLADGSAAPPGVGSAPDRLTGGHDPAPHLDAQPPAGVRTAASPDDSTGGRAAPARVGAPATPARVTGGRPAHRGPARAEAAGQPGGCAAPAVAGDAQAPGAGRHALHAVPEPDDSDTGNTDTEPDIRPHAPTGLDRAADPGRPPATTPVVTPVTPVPQATLDQLARFANGGGLAVGGVGLALGGTSLDAVLKARAEAARQAESA
ncbi:putative protein OS=Streptomyces microflavus OX=1919 GN=Smic_04370 PE=4 SV=1 [Streptomyces microflavus]